jgi:hypothetical protein
MVNDDKTIIDTALEDAAQWMNAACDEIDAKFGKGHARNNPGLVSTYMRVTSENVKTMVEARRAGRTLDEIKQLNDALSSMSSRFRELLPYLQGALTRVMGEAKHRAP